MSGRLQGSAATAIGGTHKARIEVTCWTGLPEAARVPQVPHVEPNLYRHGFVDGGSLFFGQSFAAQVPGLLDAREPRPKKESNEPPHSAASEPSCCKGWHRLRRDALQRGPSTNDAGPTTKGPHRQPGASLPIKNYQRRPATCILKTGAPRTNLRDFFCGKP